jgi:hypothetical protein
MNAEEPDGAWVRLRRGFAVTFVQHDGTAERVKVCANQSLAISDDGFGYLYNTDTDADEGAEQTWVAAVMTRGLKANSLGYELYVSGVSGRSSVW